MGLKILHSADWHLDSPFAGFTPEQRFYLRQESLKLPERIADLCRREGCDLMLLAGDLFDGEAKPETVDSVRRALEKAAVPVFISPGNHDFCAPGSPWLEEVWPENVHIFTGELTSVPVESLDCRVYGAGYRSMDCPGLLEGFRAEGEEAYHVAVLHGDPIQLRSPYCPVTAPQVRDSGLDYLALGHIHRAGSFLAGAGRCAWPGCPMGRGFDETGEKGVYLVELDGTAAVRFVPLDTPRFFELEVDSGENALAALEAQLPAAGNLDFYRITLTGTANDDIRPILERFPNLQLRDLREEPADVWESADNDSLEGLFFRLLRDKLRDADPEDACRIQLAAEISRKLLDGKEVTLP